MKTILIKNGTLVLENYVSRQDLLIKVGCQAGTYIRKLAHDIGQKLGCGAHMAELVRTKAGPFNYHNWASLQDLKDAYEMWKEGDEKEIRKIIGDMPERKFRSIYLTLGALYTETNDFDDAKIFLKRAIGINIGYLRHVQNSPLFEKFRRHKSYQSFLLEMSPK